jgi:hypothetical protein
MPHWQHVYFANGSLSNRAMVVLSSIENVAAALLRPPPCPLQVT